MNENFIQLSYQLPEKHIFEKRRDDSFMVKFVKNTKHLLGQIKLFLSRKKLNRTVDFVKDSYQQNYSLSNLDWYDILTGDNRTPRRERDKIFVGDGVLLISAYAQIRSQIFNELNCSSVLDMGSGRGDQVIALASLNPTFDLYGLELTKNGYLRSLEWKDDVQKRNMNLVDIGEDMKKIDFEKVHFFNGSGTKIPIEDKSVDASYTNLVLEQIPNEYQDVLREMRRVTRKYCVFIEPFRESLTFADKMDLKNRDYFRHSYKTFLQCGLRPVYFSTKIIKKTKFGTGILIAEVI